MKRYTILLLLLFTGTGISVAQQAATYAQYMFNGLAINPAYAGSQDALNISFLGRLQNVGLPGAPNTQTFSAHTPLLNERMGVGVLFIRDNMSVINQSGVHFSYSYRIPLNRHKAALSFGLQGGASIYNAEYTQLDLFNNPNSGSTDPVFANNIRSTKPNIGAGVYFTTSRSYIGLSMPSMASNVFERGADYTTVYQAVPMMLTAGHVFNLNRAVKWKPNFLFKLVDNKPVEIDINNMLLFDEVLWLGFSYKSSKQMVFLTQFKINDQLQAGYSYSVSGGPLRVIQLGSHEFMVSYRFLFNKKGVISPRYF